MFSKELLTALLLGPFFLWGCAGDKDLERVNRRQAATIDSLNQEILRLNDELDQLLRSREDLSKAKSELEKKLAGELASGNLSISMQERGLVVTVLDRVLFDAGRAELKPSSMETLDKVADIAARRAKGHRIYVEGHTDNEPIRHSGWRSNWELSTARAAEVIHYFIDAGKLPAEVLAAIGYAQFQPVADNRTPDGKMKNRRVDIVISPKKIGD